MTSHICKVFEKCVYKHLFEHVSSHNLLYEYQSGFIPGDSCTNQLVDIYDKIMSSSDNGKNVAMIFCDIAKAFDRVSHRGLLCKLKTYGISDCMILWLRNFLSDRLIKTRVQSELSGYLPITSGVPQGSVLGPLLFLLYINDLPRVIQNDSRLFADDTSIIYEFDQVDDVTIRMNNDLRRISEWARTWLISFNAAKTKFMVISKSGNVVIPCPVMDGVQIERVSSHRHLGVILNDKCTWSDHIEMLISKISSRIGVMRYLKKRLDRRSLRTIYIMYIRSKLDYADIIWDNCHENLASRLETIQNDCARIITGLPKPCPIRKLLDESRLEPLWKRRENRRMVLIYKMLRGLSPRYLQWLLPDDRMLNENYNFRNLYSLTPVPFQYAFYRDSVIPKSIRQWNLLEVDTRALPSVAAFKNRLQIRFSVEPLTCEVSRFTGIIQTQLRYDVSPLNSHRYKMRIVESRDCQCGHGQETTRHFLLQCPFYDLERNILIMEVRDITRRYISSKLLLFGHSSLSSHENNMIFSSCQRYIASTRRFQ